MFNHWNHHANEQNIFYHVPSNHSQNLGNTIRKIEDSQDHWNTTPESQEYHAHKPGGVITEPDFPNPALKHGALDTYMEDSLKESVMKYIFSF